MKFSGVVIVSNMSGNKVHGPWLWEIYRVNKTTQTVRQILSNVHWRECLYGLYSKGSNISVISASWQICVNEAWCDHISLSCSRLHYETQTVWLLNVMRLLNLIYSDSSCYNTVITVSVIIILILTFTVWKHWKIIITCYYCFAIQVSQDSLQAEC